MKLKSFIRSSSGKLALSIAALTLTAALGFTAVFAWFLISETPKTGDVGGSVVGGTNVSLDLAVNGTPNALTFENLLPGETLECAVTMRNNTTSAQYIALDMRRISNTIRDHASEDPSAIDETKSMLNVIAVSVPIVLDDGSIVLDATTGEQVMTDFAPFAQMIRTDSTYVEQDAHYLDSVTKNVIPDPKNANVRILSGLNGVRVPALGSAEGNTVKLNFKIQFSTEIVGSDGVVMKDAAGDDLDINDYQSALFRIGQLRLIEI